MIHFVSLSKPVKSSLYDKYWLFASRRFDVFKKRMYNDFGPWTNDSVIALNRFTNVFRVSDRVSQYLVALQYQNLTKKDIFFTTMLFKIFNKIETYNYLLKELKEVKYDSYYFTQYDDLLTRRMSENIPIYSAAYIMPSAGSAFGYKLKHSNHLALLQKMMDDEMPEKVAAAGSLQEIYELLLSYPSFGSFLAFQYTIDLNYSALIDFSEMDFVVAGPGAKNGILKCFSSLGDYSFEDIIKYVCDIQEEECNKLGLESPSLLGRRLQLIDCQNLFCETDKYLRVTNPEAAVAGRTRIKQKYKLSRGPISFFFPPKWNLNSQIYNQWQSKTEGIYL